MISKDPICFYLVDPKSGVVIERNHCLFGKSIAGKVLVFPNGKGSSVVQADGMYQLKMKGMAPKAMIVDYPDTTLVASAIIMEMPLVDKTDSSFKTGIQNGNIVHVDATHGTITVNSES
ncbi:aconitate hydratase X [Agrilactobacillus composti DSM 18527 = JCM 14202]|nr:aconitate hydratase X [Agrilactobacillus composti DSM 18527 = JCM 14202]